MGCDIHAHSEVKINGKWHHLNALQISRDYNLFAKMADVRNGLPKIEPIAEPRGLPKGATRLTRFESARYGTDGHSHSWLSAAEVAELGEWMEARHKERSSEYFYCESVLGYVLSSGWDAFTKYREDLPDGVEDARLVFWFDN